MQRYAVGLCTRLLLDQPRPRRRFGSGRTETGTRSIQSQCNASAESLPQPIANEKVWTKSGDIEFIDSDDDLVQVVIYVTEAQDRMDRKEQCDH